MGVLLDLGMHSFADLGFVILAVLVMKIFTVHGSLGCACVMMQGGFLVGRGLLWAQG